MSGHHDTQLADRITELEAKCEEYRLEIIEKAIRITGLVDQVAGMRQLLEEVSIHIVEHDATWERCWIDTEWTDRRDALLKRET